MSIGRADYIMRGQSLLGQFDGALLANVLALVIVALLLAGG